MSSRYIHDILLNDIEITALETEIIDTTLFQALRQVKQLGMVNRVFLGRITLVSNTRCKL